MATIAVGGALNFEQHNQTVEAALDADDFTPLVRLVFDAVASSLTSNTSKQALLTRAPTASPDGGLDDGDLGEDGAPVGRRASDRVRAARKEAGAPVIAELEKIVQSRSAELSQICRSNAEEIVSSLQELDAMEQGTQELQERITSADEALRQSGSHFLDGLEQLQDLRKVQSSVAASCQAVGAAKQLLQLCALAGRAVNGNELYKAFKLLERAQAEFLGPPSDPTQNGAQSAALHDGPSKMLDRQVQLHAFMLARLQEMQSAIEQKAIADFNNWLVNARSEARPAGLAVLKKAAWDRQRQASLLQQRRRLAANLETCTGPEAAAALATPLSLRSAGPATLRAAAHPAAAALLEGSPVDPHADPLKGIDMTQLHRCIQMHACLQKLPSLQGYYQVNRRMQLNNDLAAQGNFVAQPQACLAQLVGFFVIENRVCRTAEALSTAQVDAGWDTAVAYLKLAMDTAFETISSAASMLLIKDLVLLVSSALGQCGYHFAPLLDVLTGAKAKYHELLAAALEPEFSRIVAECSGRAIQVRSADQAAELSASLGLPLSWRSGDESLGPTPPFSAPFSSAVPELLRITRRYVEDSAAYMWGLVSQGEALAVARLQRDSMLVHLPLQALGTAIKASSPASDPAALDRALQAVADVDALTEALQALDDFTFVTVRGMSSKRGADSPQRSPSEVIGTAASQQAPMGPPSLGSNGNSTPPSHSAAHLQMRTYSSGLTGKLAELRTVAQQQVSRVLVRQLRDVVLKSTPLDWLPEQPVQTARSHSQYILALLTALKEVLGRVAQRVSGRAYQQVGRSLMQLVGELLMGMLLTEEVPAYNLYALFRLNDDVLALADFATRADVTGMEEGLQEVIQFCDLMVTGRLEEILDGNKRAKSYPAVNLRHLLVLLRKYREVSSKPGHGHGLMRGKQPESFLKKKVAENVAKQIKSQLEHAGVTNLPK